jgi:transcriptional regulator with XRE-family HTH domain
VIELTKRREERGMTKQALSYASHVPATTIGQIESGRFHPYGPQLIRLALALGFDRDPADLLQPVDEPVETPVAGASPS